MDSIIILVMMLVIVATVVWIAAINRKIELLNKRFESLQKFVYDLAEHQQGTTLSLDSKLSSLQADVLSSLSGLLSAIRGESVVSVPLSACVKHTNDEGSNT